MTKYFRDFQPDLVKLIATDEKANRSLAELLSAVYVVLTSSGDDVHKPHYQRMAEREHIAKPIGRSYGDLRTSLGHELADIKKPQRALVNALVQLQAVAQYLCWAQVSAREVINLEVTYSVEDARRPLFPGHADVSTPKAAGSPSLTRHESRLLEFYRRCGLAPQSYAFRIPSRDHAGSYYFSLDPPPNSVLTFLDWGSSNSLDDKSEELDSAHPSVHTHSSDTPSASSQYGEVIFAHIRASAREHKKIAAGAALNLLFVLLITTENFSSSFSMSGAQIWLLLTPTILIAFLAEQQRHYYAHATRRQRGALWVYLAVGVAFLIVASLEGVSGWVTSWSVAGQVISGLFALTSAVVIAWWAPLGYSLEKYTTKWFKKGRVGKRNGHERYTSMILKYCNAVIGLICVALLATVIAATAIVLAAPDEVEPRFPDQVEYGHESWSP